MKKYHYKFWIALFLLAGVHSQIIAVEYSYTPSPIIAYSPTDGSILGGALFYHPRDPVAKGTTMGLQFAANKHQDGMFIFEYQQFSRLSELSFGLESSFSSFRYYDYGSGNQTSADSFQIVEGSNFEIKPQLKIPGFAESIWIAFINYRSRTEDAVDGNPSLQLSPESSRYSVGIRQEFDQRNDHLNPTKGTYLAWEVSVLPEQDGANKQVSNIEFEYRFFMPITNDLSSATRFSAGAFSDDPGYLFRYGLGGENGLRGFYANRFSGDHYYLLQQEFRFPLWKIISGTVFVEAGDVSYGALDNMRTATGVGLRFGLPPDFRMKLRFDFGVDDEGETAMFVNFGQFF